MGFRSRVIDRDFGWEDEMEAVRRVSSKAHVTVGIHSTQGAVELALVTGEVTIAAYAAFNEFGTATIPERPFMRQTFDQNVAKYIRVMGVLGKHILERDITLRLALSAIGETAEADVKNMISAAGSWAKANKASTLARKGPKGPLIDTGRMKGSVRHVVHQNAPIERRGV